MARGHWKTGVLGESIQVSTGVTDVGITDHLDQASKEGYGQVAMALSGGV